MPRESQEMGRLLKGERERHHRFERGLGILSVSSPLLVWAKTCKENSTSWEIAEQFLCHPLEYVGKILVGLDGLSKHLLS